MCWVAFGLIEKNNLGAITLRQNIFVAFLFRGFLSNFWILLHFNFAVHPKYYILWHFALCPKYHNLRNFNFMLVAKNSTLCMSFKHFRNFRKSMNPKCKLRCTLTFFTHCWFTKVLKTVSPRLVAIIFSGVSPFGLLEVSRSAFSFVQETKSLLLKKYS